MLEWKYGFKIKLFFFAVQCSCVCLLRSLLFSTIKRHCCCSIVQRKLFLRRKVVSSETWNYRRKQESFDWNLKWICRILNLKQNNGREGFFCEFLPSTLEKKHSGCFFQKKMAFSRRGMEYGQKGHYSQLAIFFIFNWDGKCDRYRSCTVSNAGV